MDADNVIYKRYDVPRYDARCDESKYEPREICQLVWHFQFNKLTNG